VARKWPYNRAQTRETRVRWTESEFKGLEDLQREIGAQNVTETLKAAVLMGLLNCSLERRVGAEAKKKSNGR